MVLWILASPAPLLPGALITNNTTRFISKKIKLKVTNSNSLFTQNYQINEDIEMPIAHKQGNYYANKDLIDRLEDNNQIAFKYIKNPNGSSGDIAGILNKNKNILGMMPHPERAAELLLGECRGVEIFRSMLHQVLW